MFMYLFLCVFTSNGVQTVQLICLKLSMLYKHSTSKFAVVFFYIKDYFV